MNKVSVNILLINIAINHAMVKLTFRFFGIYPTPLVVCNASNSTSCFIQSNIIIKCFLFVQFEANLLRVNEDLLSLNRSAQKREKLEIEFRSSLERENSSLKEENNSLEGMLMINLDVFRFVPDVV